MILIMGGATPESMALAAVFLIVVFGIAGIVWWVVRGIIKWIKDE